MTYGKNNTVSQLMFIWLYYVFSLDMGVVRLKFPCRLVQFRDTSDFYVNSFQSYV